MLKLTLMVESLQSTLSFDFLSQGENEDKEVSKDQLVSILNATFRDSAVDKSLLQQMKEA